MRSEVNMRYMQVDKTDFRIEITAFTKEEDEFLDALYCAYKTFREKWYIKRQLVKNCAEYCTSEKDSQ